MRTWTALTLVCVLVISSHGASEPVAEAPAVVAGGWMLAHGPRPLYSSHLYDVLGFAPGNTVTFKYVPQNPADAKAVAFRAELVKDRGVFPGLCFEVDPATKLPMTVAAGRERVGGFESVKERLFGGGSVVVREQMVSLHFGRLKNSTLPLIVTKANGPMVIRCGPLLKRTHAEALPTDRVLELIEAGAFANGNVPAGFDSYLLSKKVLQDPFITFEVHAALPLISFEQPNGAVMAAVRARSRRNYRAADVSEETLRKHGLDLTVALAYDSWNVDWANATAVDELKRRIANGFVCRPTPCHRRLRSRNKYFTSVKDLIATVGTDPAQLDAFFHNESDVAASRVSGDLGDDSAMIIRPGDITVHYGSARIQVPPDALFERGFDLLHDTEPLDDNVAFGGKPIAVPETHHVLRFHPPADLTLRWPELDLQLNHAAAPAGLSYTMTAYPHAPPRPQLSEMDPKRQHFVPVSHPLVVTEDCVAGRNHSEFECPRRIVTTLRFSRPEQFFVNYMRQHGTYREYLFREIREDAAAVDEGLPATEREFFQCRQEHFGWPAIRDTFVSMNDFLKEERPRAAVFKQPPHPRFDIDREVHLDLALHYAMFLSQQPAEPQPPLRVTLKPAPGILYVTVTPDDDAPAVPKLNLGEASRREEPWVWALPPRLSVRFELVGDVLRPLATADLAATTAAVESLINASFRVRSKSGATSSLSQAGLRVTASTVDVRRKEPCGGVDALTVYGLKITRRETDSVPADAAAIELGTPQEGQQLDLLSASGLVPQLNVTGVDPFTLVVFTPSQHVVSDEL